jgi:type IV fimbrial biogenesis protein FimT
MRHPHQSGFTLVETMVIVAITAILMTLAVPMFTTFVAQRSVTSHVRELSAAIRLARNEAMKRGQPVTICATADPLAAAPGCSAGGAGAWAAGWLVFLDRNADQAVSANDVIIKVQNAFTNSGGIIAGANNAITFQANGIAFDVQDTFTLYPKLDSSSADYASLTKRLCVNATGAELRTC